MMSAYRDVLDLCRRVDTACGAALVEMDESLRLHLADLAQTEEGYARLRAAKERAGASSGTDRAHVMDVVARPQALAEQLMLIELEVSRPFTRAASVCVFVWAWAWV